jgi:hypothetical protein
MGVSRSSSTGPAIAGTSEVRPEALQLVRLAHESRIAGRETRARTVELPGGALMATNPAQPTSAYYARRGWRFEVEVYHPTAGEAMRLVLSKAVREVR